MSPEPKELIGQRFGFLVVEEVLPGPGKRCRLRCDCGDTTTVRELTNLKTSVKKGCKSSCSACVKDLRARMVSGVKHGARYISLRAQWDVKGQLYSDNVLAQMTNDLRRRMLDQ